MKYGKVIKIRGGTAVVETALSESPCSSCKSPCAERICEKTSVFNVRAENRIGASVGDRVILLKKSSLHELLFGILCMFFPLAAGFIGYFISAGQGVSERTAVLLSILFFAASEAVSAAICGFISLKFPSFSVESVTDGREIKD